MAGSETTGSGLDGNAVRSVDRAAALLLALGESRGEAGVTELARRLGLHKSTASRLLATLERRGLVEQDPETGKYRLGLAIIRLAGHAERTLDLRGIAMPELERVARATHESVCLAVLEGEAPTAVAILNDGSSGGASGASGVPGAGGGGGSGAEGGSGVQRPAAPHAAATGKVLLSALPEREIARIARRGLPKLTPRTIVDLEPLLEELARVRRLGYATALGEYEDGVNAVAAPVQDARGNVVAAVGVFGPAGRLTPGRLPELAARARQAALAISARLGASPT